LFPTFGSIKSKLMKDYCIPKTLKTFLIKFEFIIGNVKDNVHIVFLWWKKRKRKERVSLRDTTFFNQ